MGPQRRPSIHESPKDANQQPFAHLGTAFQRFFRRQGKYPRLKKKARHVTSSTFGVDGKAIRLPKIGTVRMRDPSFLVPSEDGGLQKGSLMMVQRLRSPVRRSLISLSSTLYKFNGHQCV